MSLPTRAEAQANRDASGTVCGKTFGLDAFQVTDLTRASISVGSVAQLIASLNARKIPSCCP